MESESISYSFNEVEALMVAFGNYVLSPSRASRIMNPENLHMVGDWDIQNFWVEQAKTIGIDINKDIITDGN